MKRLEAYWNTTSVPIRLVGAAILLVCIGNTPYWLYIKAGAEEAYAAFSTIELAELFIKFWRMPESTIIIPAKELGRSYPVFSDITNSAVIFKSYEQLESYFRSPEQYPCSEHVEPLGLS